MFKDHYLCAIVKQNERTMTKRFEKKHKAREQQMKDLIQLSLNPFLYRPNIHFYSDDFLQAYDYAFEFRNLLAFTFGAENITTTNAGNPGVIIYFTFDVSLPGGRNLSIVFSSIPDNTRQFAFDPEVVSSLEWTGNERDESEIQGEISVNIADGYYFGVLKFEAIGHDNDVDGCTLFEFREYKPATDTYSGGFEYLSPHSPEHRAFTEGDKFNQLIKKAEEVFRKI